MKKLQNVGRQSEAFFLNIIFRRIYQSGAKCILCCFVHVVHTELSEDILPVGIHGMETGEALLGNFLGSHTQSDILENLGFGLGEIHFFFYFLRRSKEHLHHSLADKTLAIYAEAYRLLDFHQQTLLQEHAELRTAGDENLHEIGTQILTEQ